LVRAGEQVELIAGGAVVVLADRSGDKEAIRGWIRALDETEVRLLRGIGVRSLQGDFYPVGESPVPLVDLDGVLLAKKRHLIGNGGVRGRGRQHHPEDPDHDLPSLQCSSLLNRE